MAGVRIKRGRLVSPGGEEYLGFSVTLGGITDPASIERSYKDIDRIFKANPGSYSVKEERDAEGKFKSFIVETC